MTHSSNDGNPWLVFVNEPAKMTSESRSSFMTRTVSDTYTVQSETDQSAFGHYRVGSTTDVNTDVNTDAKDTSCDESETRY